MWWWCSFTKWTNIQVKRSSEFTSTRNGRGGEATQSKKTYAGSSRHHCLISWKKWVRLRRLSPSSAVAMRETWVQSLGWEDPLENGKTTHPSILAWRMVAKSRTWLSNFQKINSLLFMRIQNVQVKHQDGDEARMPWAGLHHPSYWSAVFSHPATFPLQC